VNGMDTYSVHVETRGDDPSAVTDAALGRFVDAIGAIAGVATGGGGHPSWGAMICVDARNVADAVVKAIALVVVAGGQARLPEWPVVRADAMRQDVGTKELASAAREAFASRSKRVLIASDHGRPVVAGPVYTDAGLAELRALVDDAGWNTEFAGVLVSKAELTEIAKRARS
jgi:hypothetical protein